MVNVGHRPILWNVMKFYAHYGHKDFILCLGHQGDVIKQYFLNYNEALSNDFVLSGSSDKIQLLSSDIRRLDDHLCRHRTQLQHRTAASCRAEIRQG